MGNSHILEKFSLSYKLLQYIVSMSLLSTLPKDASPLFTNSEIWELWTTNGNVDLLPVMYHISESR